MQRAAPDGVSLVPLFKGEELQRPTPLLHFPTTKEGSGPEAIRKGDYKLSKTITTVTICCSTSLLTQERKTIWLLKNLNLRQNFHRTDGSLKNDELPFRPRKRKKRIASIFCHEHPTGRLPGLFHLSIHLTPGSTVKSPRSWRA